MSNGFRKRLIAIVYSLTLVVVLSSEQSALAIEQVDAIPQEPVILDSSLAEQKVHADESPAGESTKAESTPIEQKSDEQNEIVSKSAPEGLVEDQFYDEAYLYQQKSVEELFIRLKLKYTGGPYRKKSFSYLIYTPPDVIEGKKYPLLVWLMGGNGKKHKENHAEYLVNAIDLWRRTQGEFPAYVLAPFAPSSRTWFDNQKELLPGSIPGDGDPLTIAWTTLQHVIREHPIDEDRIALSGVSAGGSACWEMGLRYPNQFCAIAPINSSGGDTSRIGPLVNTPIWAFHNIADSSISIEPVRSSVTALQNAGGKVILKEYAEDPTVKKDKDAPIAPLGESNGVLTWLITRRRGDFMWWPPEVLTVRLITASSIGGLVLMYFACKAEFKRRKKLALKVPLPQ